MYSISRRQEEISNEKDEIDRQRKLLGKKRPQMVDGQGGSARKGRGSSAHNGSSSDGFIKPGETKERELTWQEYYESDEIFKVGSFLFIYFTNNARIIFLFALLHS